MRIKLYRQPLNLFLYSIYTNGRFVFYPRFSQNEDVHKVPQERNMQDYLHKTARSSFQIFPQI